MPRKNTKLRLISSITMIIGFVLIMGNHLFKFVPVPVETLIFPVLTLAAIPYLMESRQNHKGNLYLQPQSEKEWLLMEMDKCSMVSFTSLVGALLFISLSNLSKLLQAPIPFSGVISTVLLILTMCFVFNLSKLKAKYFAD